MEEEKTGAINFKTPALLKAPGIQINILINIYIFHHRTDFIDIYTYAERVYIFICLKPERVLSKLKTEREIREVFLSTSPLLQSLLTPLQVFEIRKTKHPPLYLPALRENYKLNRFYFIFFLFLVL